MDPVILVLRIEAIALGEIEERAIYLFEIPGVPDLERMRDHLRGGRHRTDIRGNLAHEA